MWILGDLRAPPLFAFQPAHVLSWWANTPGARLKTCPTLNSASAFRLCAHGSVEINAADYPQQLSEMFVIHLWTEFTARGDLKKGLTSKCSTKVWSQSSGFQTNPDKFSPAKKLYCKIHVICLLQHIHLHLHYY